MKRYWLTADHQFEKTRVLVLLALTLFGLPTIIFADSRLDTGSLPTTLVERQDCQLNEIYPWGGWGWDGDKTCQVTSWRLFGAEHTLTGINTAGTSLIWKTEDVANQTLRCDSYQLRYNFSARTREYKRSRYDITILNDDTIPASSANEDLSEVTAHLFTRGFETGRTGVLTGIGAIVNFSASAFVTKTGYLFIEDRGMQNNDGEFIIEKFSHCWLRDQTYPLRAAASCTDNDGDGVGWNGYEVCNAEPASATCDYSDAASNKGWGYDHTTGQRCKPQDGNTEYVPEDSCQFFGSRNGWGWNEARQESCRL